MEASDQPPKPPEFATKEERLAYWLSRTPEERLSEVHRLTVEHYGEMGRIRKVVRVINRETDEVIREWIGEGYRGD